MSLLARACNTQDQIIDLPPPSPETEATVANIMPAMACKLRQHGVQLNADATALATTCTHSHRCGFNRISRGGKGASTLKRSSSGDGRATSKHTRLNAVEGSANDNVKLNGATVVQYQTTATANNKFRTFVRGVNLTAFPTVEMACQAHNYAVMNNGDDKVRVRGVSANHLCLRNVSTLLN
jgi:hypothetical protein